MQPPGGYHVLQKTFWKLNIYLEAIDLNWCFSEDLEHVFLEKKMRARVGARALVFFFC